MSVAGGLPRAVERAQVHGCEALQIFTKNASRWRGRPVSTDEIALFRERVEKAGIRPVVSHASYLVNLAAFHPALRRQSIEAMADELDRAESLGLLGVALHPGCSTSAGAQHGIGLVGEALLELLRTRPHGRTMILLEQTARTRHDTRVTLRRACRDYRPHGRSRLHRSLPRHMPSAGRGLRPHDPCWVSRDLRHVREARRLQPAAPRACERFKAATGQPRRSP